MQVDVRSVSRRDVQFGLDMPDVIAYNIFDQMHGALT